MFGAQSCLTLSLHTLPFDTFARVLYIVWGKSPQIDKLLQAPKMLNPFMMIHVIIKGFRIESNPVRRIQTK